MAGFINYILISIFTPGPNNIYSSVSSANSGLKKTLKFMLGVFVGTFIVFTISGLFNVYLYNNIRIITKIIGIGGGIFIIYLALMMFLRRESDKVLPIKEDRVFFMAIILNFVNAKALVFGLTIATYYLELGFSPDYIVLFALLMAVLCFIAVLVWGLFGKYFSDLLKKYQVIYNIIMAALLAYSGVMIIIESI